jgi:hypothetical protein
MRKLLALLVFSIAAAGLGQDHPNLARGVQPGQLYDSLGVDHVNDFNGDLILRIPVGQQYFANGELSYQFELTYNSNIFEYGWVNNGTGLKATPTLLSNAGAGWRLSLGALLPPVGDPDYNANPGNNSTLWTFVDSTSGRHAFHPTLHDGDANDFVHSYTRDGQYIRLTWLSDQLVFRLDFADGTHQFYKRYIVPQSDGDWTASEFGTKWRLSSIEDSFGNQVTISYESRTIGQSWFPEIWHVHDGVRQHDVYFVYNATFYSMLLEHIDLKTFNGTTATYSLQYQDVGFNVSGNGDTVSGTVTAPVLTSITLPDNSQYSMIDSGTPLYDLGNGTTRPSGGLTKLQLPTTGTISWTYAKFDLDQGTWNGPTGSSKRPTPPAVATRTLADHTGTKGTWTYNRQPSNGGIWCPCSGGQFVCNAENRQLNSWRAQPDGATVISYFSIYHQGDVCSAGVWSFADYGLPGTPQTTSGVGRLATERRTSFSGYSGSGIGGFPAESTGDPLWTRSFTRFEGDAYTTGVYDRNIRPNFFRTTYDGDTTCSMCFTDLTLSGYDNFGHYRQTSVNSNVPGTPYRTTFINFPGSLDANGDWVLSTPTEQCVADEGSARTTTVGQCSELNGTTTALNYDRATGVLKGRRILNGLFAGATTQDLLSSFDYDTRGNLTLEQYWGGDAQTLTNTSSSLLFTEPQTPAYELRHDLTYNASGNLVTARSAYRNLPGTTSFNASAEDETMDAYTGLVSASKDSAGVATSFGYDTMGRLTSITPTTLAPTTITHTPGSLWNGIVFTPPAESVLTSSSTAGSIQTVRKFDPFGRFASERTLLPDGNWSLSAATYNFTGQLATLTTPQLENAGCWVNPSGCPATSYTYDSSASPKVITAPDSTSTTMVRYGSGRTDTTARNASGNTNMFHTESLDGLGRIYTVTEQSGPTSASSTNGSNVTTTYGYTTQDLLATVHMASGTNFQNRDFAWDHRGLLLSETHPESGTTSYGSYDARGHAAHSIAGAAGGTFDLTFEYDPAERLLKVKDLDGSGNRRLLKQFNYSDGNSGANYTQGKLTAATRYNHLTVGEVNVTENYTYTGPAGLLFQKDTAVTLAGSQFQTFTQTYTYNDLATANAVQYPVCAPATPCTLSGGIGTLSRGFSNGRLTLVGTGAPGTFNAYGAISYHPTGMVNEVTHPGNVVDTYAAESTGLSRPASIRFHGFTNCPSVTVTPNSPTLCAGAASSASATVISGASYSWTIDNGTINTGANAPWMTFTAGSAGTTTLHVTVITGGCTINSSASVSVTASAAMTQQPFANPSTITPQQSTFISAAASGSNLTYQWYRGPKSDTSSPVPGATGSSFTTPALTTTTTYWVRVGSSCGSVDSEIVTVFVNVPAPSAVTATTQTATNQVLIQWSAVTFAGSYQVEYAPNISGPYSSAGAPTTALSLLQTVSVSSTPVAYVYRVRSVDTSGHLSTAFSSMDYALTSSTLFTNEPLQSASTPVYARHIGELRRAIDALRAATNLTLVWPGASDPSGPVVPGPITSLFTPFNQARQAFGYPAFAYTGGVPIPQTGGFILAAHIQQIRDALR